jgi:radical SAM protein with 4Fe4S-binding SPASM domain
MELAPPLPTEIQVEVTGACNLRCEMCLVRYRPPLNRIAGSMPFDLFLTLAEAIPDVGAITLQGLGEPLLAPGLFRMVDYAAHRGIRMGFNTNGTLLTRERAEHLVQAGLEWLHVSLDGARPSTYESIRDGSNFDRVRRNVAGLVEAKRAHGSDRPRLSVVFVAMRRNVRELPEMVRLASEWGLERLWVQNLSHSFSDTDPSGAYGEIRNYVAREALWLDRDPGTKRIFDEARALAERLGVSLRLPTLAQRAKPRRPGSPGCDWPWRSTYVTHDGTVQPCCMVMGSDRATLGNLKAQSFQDIWQGPAYRAFRAALLTDDPPEVCRGCSFYRGTF